MKHNYLFIIAVCTFLTANLEAQTWQWAKSGGTTVDDINNLYNYENARSLTTDPFGNTYFVSNVSYQGLTIDGIPKEVYGGMADGLLASFACDGTPRWSKVIGGFDYDRLMAVGTDAQGNVYAAGQITPLQQNDANPVYTHFDNDTILPVSYGNVNTYKKSLFLVKYDTEGELQWLRMPQKDDISYIESITMYRCLDLQVDPEGNSYWLCHLGPGPVANGAYTVTGEGLSMHILKYDADGNFIEGIPFQMQATSGALLSFQFKRNPGDGRFYVAGSIYFYEGSAESVTIAGEAIEHGRYVAAFDENANFLWIKTSIGTAIWGDRCEGLAFDEDNNIYYTAPAYMQEAVTGSPIDGFNNIPFVLDPLGFGAFPFLVKMDSDGNTLWQTNGDLGVPTGAVVNGNEIVIVGGGRDLHWQTVNFTYPVSGTQGAHPFLLRFNKDTGTIIDANYLITTGNDYPSSVTIDSNGSYYMGGRFTQSLTANNTVASTGGDYDFFLAKFGTDNCTFLSTPENSLNELQLWPNPVKDLLNLNNNEKLSYTMYNMLGSKVGSGTLETNGQVNLSGMVQGMYLLQLQGNHGSVKTIKVVKE